MGPRFLPVFTSVALLVAVVANVPDWRGFEALLAGFVFLEILGLPADVLLWLARRATHRHGIPWNYTKTAFFILAGTGFVRIVADFGGVYNRFASGDPLLVVLAVGIVLLPITAVADWASWRKNRRARHRQ